MRLHDSTSSYAETDPAPSPAPAPAGYIADVSEGVDRPGEGVAEDAIPLRDEALLRRFRRLTPCGEALSLDAAGAYLFASLCGSASVMGKDGERLLSGESLHVLRQAAGDPSRRISFDHSGPIAVLLYFPLHWSRSCPMGESCEVARFLFGGGQGRGGDDRVELDRDGLRHVHSVLDLHVDKDIDRLSVEQFVLALLSWTFAKHSIGAIRPRTASGPHPRLAAKARQARSILLQRIGQPPTIPELSALVGTNETDLKRCFRQLFGESIAEFSRRSRLESARALLRHGADNVANVALEVGYANPSQFARAFRAQFGINPSECRRRPEQPDL
ncbi:MAG: hypothetical protein CMM50_09575 [Rhodospirillaceae bacterium]|nr:hypothetical protein [Rhodospirillaceae bacterium]